MGEHCLAVQPFQTHHSRSKQVKALQLQVGCASRFATWAVHYALHLMHGVLQVFVGCFDSQLLGNKELEWIDWHATAIPSRIYPFSSDQGSQTGLGSTSTRLSDRPGTLSAVVFAFFALVPGSFKAKVVVDTTLLVLLVCISAFTDLVV